MSKLHLGFILLLASLPIAVAFDFSGIIGFVIVMGCVMAGFFLMMDGVIDG